MLLLLSGCLFGGSINSSLLLNEIDPSDASRLCEDYEERTVELECDGEALTVLPSVLAECRTTLSSIPSECGITVGHLEDCVDMLADSTCDTDRTGGVCAPLLDSSCGGLADLIRDLAGDSPLIDDIPLSQLTPSQAEQHCIESLVRDEPSVVSCGDFEIEFGVYTLSQCLSDLATVSGNCPATVGDSEDCREALEADPCASGGLPSVCDPLIADGCV